LPVDVLDSSRELLHNGEISCTSGVKSWCSFDSDILFVIIRITQRRSEKRKKRKRKEKEKKKKKKIKELGRN